MFFCIKYWYCTVYKLLIKLIIYEIVFVQVRVVDKVPPSMAWFNEKDKVCGHLCCVLTRWVYTPSLI